MERGRGLRHHRFRGRAGRPTHSPRLLLCLWLYGISRGIGSAREIARRVRDERAFQWVAGDVAVSHDVLRDFRIEHQEALDRLMTNVLGALLHKDLLSLERVAVDGTRVRASASAPSFRREQSLQACGEQAQLHVKAVLAASHQSARARAAAEAAAKSFESRVEDAIAVVSELRAAGKPKARTSTTDADARVMKMPDGGFRPAYNVQLARPASARLSSTGTAAKSHRDALTRRAAERPRGVGPGAGFASPGGAARAAPATR
jgi:transposase